MKKHDTEPFIQVALVAEVSELRERLERLEEYVLGVLRARHERPRLERNK